MTTASTPLVCTIAGSDNSAGAGIAADNQTFRSFGVGFANVITAVTAQNPGGVHHIEQMPISSINAQWQSLSQPPSVIKTGMLGSAETLKAVLSILENTRAKVVCDPVLQASAGGALMTETTAYLKLFHQADVITPNTREFERLFPDLVNNLSLETAALQVAKAYDCAVVITGGDLAGESSLDKVTDFLAFGGEITTFTSPFRHSYHTHGTGCSFSSAVASALALNHDIKSAVTLAKAYLNQGLAQKNKATFTHAPFQHTGKPEQIEYLPAIDSLTPLPFRKPDHSLGLYAIVDSLEALAICLEHGVDTIQLRIKNTPEARLDPLIAEAVSMAKAKNCPLYINDYWSLAIKHNAYGVHLGQEDLSVAPLETIAKAGLALGISTHTWFEFSRAHSVTPSYIAIGPIFPTTTKDMNYYTIGTRQLGEWVNLLGDQYRLTAIAGITEKNCREVLASGVDSIAVIGAIQNAKDPGKAIRQLQAAIAESRPG